MPKVSVVIPAHNRARFLPACLHSILAQSFKDFEVIVVNDGSTDSTAQIVASFPVRYFYQENKGAPAARNKGLELAQGEYITFLDSDDILLEGALQKPADLLDKYPLVGFTYAQAYVIDEEGHIFGMWSKPAREPYIREGREELRRLMLGNYIPSPTVMVRRRCLEEVGAYDTSFVHGSQDFDLWVRLAKKYSVGYIAEPLAKFRLHTDSMSSTRKSKHTERSNTIILESIFNDPELKPTLSQMRPKAYFHLYRRLARHTYSQRDMGTSRKYLFKAIRTYPQALCRHSGLSLVFLFAKTWIPMLLITRARRLFHHRRINTFRERIAD